MLLQPEQTAPMWTVRPFFNTSPLLDAHELVIQLLTLCNRSMMRTARSCPACSGVHHASVTHSVLYAPIVSAVQGGVFYNEIIVYSGCSVYFSCEQKGCGCGMHG